MFLDDYIKQIDQVFKRMEGKKEMEYEVFGWFKNYVLDSKLETGIEHCAEFTESISIISEVCFLMQCSLLSLGGKVKDSHISHITLDVYMPFYLASYSFALISNLLEPTECVSILAVFSPPFSCNTDKGLVRIGGDAH
ncbi:hypothetical protein Ahy_B10g103476 isoform C [Arachis hypogaea]|uniref:Uncharacterized protein n=1 Tax=Arachis hypogaea TaxID=3818 RepID=A0A444X3S2_ARAHY|nr:hypothetical protein Ahy_B10g103476 isoform C [Arachis hypogaea]